MANKNKNLKDIVYRDSIRGDRWRFLQVWGSRWMMVRVKDGHRLLFFPDHLVLEKN
jgi:hypothetical protein